MHTGAPAGTCIVFDSRCWHMSGAFAGLAEPEPEAAAGATDDGGAAVKNNVTVGGDNKELPPLPGKHASNPITI